jgi:hypothetical protein
VEATAIKERTKPKRNKRKDNNNLHGGSLCPHGAIPVSWPRIGKEGGGGMVTRDKAMIWGGSRIAL